MINKNLIKLMDKLKNDSEYLKNMKGIKNNQELYDYCSNIVPGYSKEEFDIFMQNMINANNELKSLSDENLTSVAGGTGFIDWIKNKMPEMPEMPKSKHDFRLKVGSNSVWTNNLNTTATRLSQLSAFIQVGEMMYFDDLDKIPPEKLLIFISDLTGQT